MTSTDDEFNNTICPECGYDFKGPMKDKAQELALHTAEVHDQRPADNTKKEKGVEMI